MKTNFTDEQRQDPRIARIESILQTCVHCGMCTATCPSYQILGDEIDSPRGRIYLMKDMFEAGRPADEKTVTHIDRCLTCLSCMTTCPSGVDYMHLVDEGRQYIEETYQRPLADRALRQILAKTVPYSNRFRFAMRMARLGKPFAKLMPTRLRAMLEIAPSSLPKSEPIDKPQTHRPSAPKARVAILRGCAQPVLNKDIQRATVSLLNRLDVEVIDLPETGCCGALVEHMGQVEPARAQAENNIRAWINLHREAPLDAIIVNTSGCGTTMKDYGHLFAGTELAEDAARIAGLTKDISEYLDETYPVLESSQNLTVAYHSACSLQHGQKVKTIPQALLKRAGFTVKTPVESHLCCGSAGVYNLLQSEIATELGARKAENLENTKPDIIAAGNIGCMTQIGQYSDVPIVHTVELLDWAMGGKKPPALLKS